MKRARARWAGLALACAAAAWAGPALSHGAWGGRAPRSGVSFGLGVGIGAPVFGYGLGPWWGPGPWAAPGYWGPPGYWTPGTWSAGVWGPPHWGAWPPPPWGPGPWGPQDRALREAVPPPYPGPQAYVAPPAYRPPTTQPYVSPPAYRGPLGPGDPPADAATPRIPDGTLGAPYVCQSATVGEQLGPAGPSAPAAGTIVGALLPGPMGQQVDLRDQACIAQALEWLPAGRRLEWQALHSRARFSVTTGAVQQRADQPCRRFEAEVTLDGPPQRVAGLACRRGDGVWSAATG